LSSPSNEFRPQLTHDGLEIFFASNRPGGLGLQDIWTSTRPDLFSPWDPPVNLDAINTSANDGQPTISADRKVLLFTSTRPGGYGGQDLWMSVRTRVKPGR
jgi:Tol biopolymer transport system component